MVTVAANGTLGKPQLLELAEATDSFADTDGDGEVDDLLHFDWNSSDADYGRDLTALFEALLTTRPFDEVALVVNGDDHGFVAGVDPASYADVVADGATDIEFTLSFLGTIEPTTGDQLFPLSLELLADRRVRLGSVDVIVVVPGEGS